MFKAMLMTFMLSSIVVYATSISYNDDGSPDYDAINESMETERGVRE